jgi:hypothetical protein
MRKILNATVAAAILSAGALLATTANAITLTAPAGARAAIEQTNVVEQTRYVCRQVRGYGGWRRVCSYQRPYYAVRPYYNSYPYNYGYYRPYYYGPYAYAPWRRPGIGLHFRF